MLLGITLSVLAVALVFWKINAARPGQPIAANPGSAPAAVGKHFNLSGAIQFVWDLEMSFPDPERLGKISLRDHWILNFSSDRQKCHRLTRNHVPHCSPEI